VTYVYDPDGNLIRRTVDSTTTTYVVDTNGDLPVILLDRTSSGTTATYVYGDDLICFHDGDRTADRYYSFYGGLGSVRIITDDISTAGTARRTHRLRHRAETGASRPSASLPNGTCD